MATRRGAGDEGWTLVKAPGRGARARRGGTGAQSGIPEAFLQSGDVRIEEVLEAVPSDAAARRAAPADLVLDVDVKPGEAALLAIRHPSGALTFHPSTDRVARSGRRAAAAPSAARFRVPVRRTLAAGAGRRGPLTAALKVVVVKVTKAAVDKAVSVALPTLALVWESRTWAARGLQEGWFRVTPVQGPPAGIRLTPEAPPPNQRSLLLVHGTFSNAASAFGTLAGTDFFERIRPLYGDRIYAFDHFTVSRTPDENARMLVDALPAGTFTFDAVTHSRGGLVLRGLVEHESRLGPRIDRFRLGTAVLVASPNDGTPLATPARWEATVGWFANLMEVFPDNPFTTGAEFVSESLVWLASHLANDLPGLRAMDGGGTMVADLQSPPGPPANAYSALVSNFHPDAALFERALDVGVDQFFGSANDLVVPSEGGWRIDRDGSAHVPANRIGCFGPGGNLDGSGDPVHHLNFFGRSETSEFTALALAGRPHSLTPVDPNAALPDRRFARGTRAISGQALRTDDHRPVADAGRAAADAGRAAAGVAGPAPGQTLTQPDDDHDTFHIVIMDGAEVTAASAPGDVTGTGASRQPGTRSKYARVFASYAGARVIGSMRLHADRGEPPTAFGRMISLHERIKKYTNGEIDPVSGLPEPGPTDGQLLEFGGLLFDTLFQGDVRRLYDEARSRQRGRKLDLILTSTIPWIAEKPWEFAHDKSRASFLATEEIHFVRNALTAVPADPIVECVGPLRILVASAQPVGLGGLSIAQEEEVVRRGFEPLIEHRLAEVDVLPRATPETIHGYLETGKYSIVHFIGHGVFDETKQEGCLLFEDPRGGPFTVGERSTREIFCKRGISLVFLNACQSGSGGRADFNKGVAQSLVAHGLPALVANQYSVLDSSATSFAQHFYWALAQGQTLGQAAREARIAVNYSLHGEAIDWAVPVLYARDPNMAFCSKPAVATRVPTTATRTTSRRATATRARRVAVWDVDNAFPALKGTLQRMNAAQAFFGFELVDMSAPIDVWDRKDASGARYLHAPRLARRLQGKPAELGVDLLVCVTRHWMRDDEWLNLYGWWPDDRKPAVAVFSVAGFDELQAEGPDTDRAIANNMVTLLTGFFGDLDTHAKGSQSCPLAFNEERRIQHLTGRQRFDAACRRKVQKVLPKELPSLEALLNAFT